MIRREFRFDCQQCGDDGVLEIVPRIDGASLIELIDRFEIAAGCSPRATPMAG